MIEIKDGECLNCGKELPEPFLVCFKCSTEKKDEVYKKLEQFTKERYNERIERS